MVTIQQINEAIMFGDISNSQLESIIGAIKFKRKQLMEETKRGLKVGSDVKFVNNRTGHSVVGKVTAIKTKNVIVNTGPTNWKVPANMLEVV